jgi:hypothetical protein
MFRARVNGFYRPPRFGDRNAHWMHPRRRGLRIEHPTGRIPRFEWHELQRDREMNQVQIEIIKLQVAQCFFQRWANVLRGVVGVPQLGGNPEILAPTGAATNGLP